MDEHENSGKNIHNRQRIILVSHRFSNEAVTAVHWLIESYDMDIKCVQIIPYDDEDKESYYLQRNTILPVAGISEYKVRPYSGKSARRGSGGLRNDDEVTQYCEAIRDNIAKTEDLDPNMRPSKHSRWAGTNYSIRYYNFWDVDNLWDNWQLSYRILLYNESDSKEKYRNKTCVFLGVAKTHLLQNGVTEQKIGELSEASESICEESETLKVLL